MTQIREMNSQDAAAVSRLYSESWARTYGHLFEDEMLKHQIAIRFDEPIQRAEAENADTITLVAVENGQIVGATSSSMDERNQAWLDRMHILPDYFGTSLAEKLLKATLIKHSGLQSIALKVLQTNKRAIRFYEKNGFMITDEIANDNKVGGVTTCIMSRTLPRG